MMSINSNCSNRILALRTYAAFCGDLDVMERFTVSIENRFRYFIVDDMKETVIIPHLCWFTILKVFTKTIV